MKLPRFPTKWTLAQTAWEKTLRRGFVGVISVWSRISKGKSHLQETRADGLSRGIENATAQRI
jgi:hypothetical protein